MEKKLGKIESAYYGFCGYQEAMIGLRISIGGDGWGVGADKPGAWAMEPTSNSKWNKQDQIEGLGKNALEISKLLKDAKVMTVEGLRGKPVECFFEGNTLREWRILTEVL